ncbi:MAG TPA: nuclear transport factor 2 family protein [Negativicutes bacterium]|nr:nuclear transport factor 2 family protein [Negativicutes bacterium]
MKQKFLLSSLVVLFLTLGAGSVEAAANPIPSTSAPSTVSTAPGAPPPPYLQAVKTLQENKYGENELKSFVYQIFSLFDRHADVSQMLLLFADDELDMRLPEGQIASHRDFEKWYAGIGSKYQSNTHTLERIDVQIPSKGDYRVDLVVHWQALDRAGKFTSFRAHQQWKIVDGGGYWPRIVSYIVEPAR